MTLFTLSPHFLFLCSSKHLEFFIRNGKTFDTAICNTCENHKQHRRTQIKQLGALDGTCRWNAEGMEQEKTLLHCLPTEDEEQIFIGVSWVCGA